MASIKKRPNGRWRARYRDADGREHARHFDRKVDGQRWLDEVTADVLTGRYVDPRAGRTTLRTFGTAWLAAQSWDVSTRQNVTSRLNVHVFPELGDVELRHLRPSMIQAWVRGRTDVSAPSHVRVVLTNLSSILAAAVEDGLIPTNPCASAAVKAPTVERRRVVPWTVAQVGSIADAHPKRYRAVPVVGYGLGLRQGEILGLRVEDVDFLRRVVHVRRQVKLVKSRPVFAPPKGGRERDVPLPDVVSVALAEHLRHHPATEVTLPWRDHGGRPETGALVFTTPAGKAVNRNRFNPDVWKPALAAAGIIPKPGKGEPYPAAREAGMHQLRHHFASVLLDGGVSVRALAEYLGHADPGFTLRVYSHLMPETESRARTAIDAAHAPADSPRTDAEGLS